MNLISKTIILTEKKSKYETSLFTIFALSTLFTCYGIAAMLGHVEPWLPLISDCAVEYPEAYIFRAGLTLSSFFIFFNSYQMYLCLKNIHKYHVYGNIFSNVSLIISLFSTICLGIVAVVNEKENDKLHSLAAITFFTLQTLYMWIILVLLKINENKNFLHKYLNLTKTIIVILYTIDILCCALFVSNFNDNKIKIAITEWLAMILICLFNVSFVSNYKNNMGIAILWNDCNHVE